MSRYTDKVVLITGAASGIGKASAERIASEGGKIICVDKQHETVEQVAADIITTGGDAFAIACDVTDQASVKATVEAAIENYGKLNALCNIAGVLRFDHTLKLKMEDFDFVMNVNARGAFMMCQAAIPHLGHL